MQAKILANVSPAELKAFKYMTYIAWREVPVQFAENRAALRRQIFANRGRLFRLYEVDDSFNYVLRFVIDRIPDHVHLPANELDAWLDDLLA